MAALARSQGIDSTADVGRSRIELTAQIPNQIANALYIAKLWQMGIGMGYRRQGATPGCRNASAGALLELVKLPQGQQRRQQSEQ